MKLWMTTLNFNVNIDNLFNTRTAQAFYQWRDLSLYVTDDKLISKNWDLDDPEVGFIPDPAFMMKKNFYPPIAVRLGVRLSF